MDSGKKETHAKLEIQSSSRPDYRVSRRNFVAVVSGGVSFAAMLASNLSFSDTAQAGPRVRRRRYRRRQNRRWNSWFRRKALSRQRGRSATCFLKGTRIQTSDGEIRVEELRPGDLVTTVAGKNMPIKWVGRMTFRRAPGAIWTRGIAPIKVSKSALAEGLPANDLYVSGGHHLLLNGLLIPTSALVNDLTISRCTSMDAEVLEYFHIELEEHNVVLAEGVPAETLLVADAQAFDNYEERLEPHDGGAISLEPYAPRAANDGILEHLNSRILSIVSPIYDKRRTLESIRDELADRAERKPAS